MRSGITAPVPAVLPLTGARQECWPFAYGRPRSTPSTRRSQAAFIFPRLAIRQRSLCREAAREWEIISGDFFDYGLVLLRGFIAFLCLVLWYRNRKERLFVWVAVYTAAPVAIDILNRLFRIPFPWNVARALNQPIYALYHISHVVPAGLAVAASRESRDRSAGRGVSLSWPWRPASPTGSGVLLGLGHAWMQWADGCWIPSLFWFRHSRLLSSGMALRRKQDVGRWAVALGRAPLAVDLHPGSRQRTGPPLYPLVVLRFHQSARCSHIQQVYFYPEKVVSLALFAAILFAVYRYALEQQARHNVMERELQSAREIQQVLVPRLSPPIEGYAVTSAYQPAMEVGGDFFQIIPNPDGSTMVALGDVSGKGLKAGMSVSMIVGVLRAEAGHTSPAEILAP